MIPLEPYHLESLDRDRGWVEAILSSSDTEVFSKVKLWVRLGTRKVASDVGT